MLKINVIRIFLAILDFKIYCIERKDLIYCLNLYFIYIFETKKQKKIRTTFIKALR